MNQARRTIWSAGLIAASHLLVQPTWAESPQKATFTVAISTEKLVYKVGEDVALRVRFTNVSHETLAIDRCKQPFLAEESDDIRVFTSDGAAVPKTEWGREIYDRKVAQYWISADAGFPVDPGKTLDDYSHPNKVYDMSRPGTYLISLAHRMYALDDKTIVTIRSNVLTVTVTQ